MNRTGHNQNATSKNFSDAEQNFLERYSLKKVTVPKQKVEDIVNLTVGKKDDDLKEWLNPKYKIPKNKIRKSERLEYRDLSKVMKSNVPWWLGTRGALNKFSGQRLVSLVEVSDEEISYKNERLEAGVDKRFRKMDESRGSVEMAEILNQGMEICLMDQSRSLRKSMQTTKHSISPPKRDIVVSDNFDKYQGKKIPDAVGNVLSSGSENKSVWISKTFSTDGSETKSNKNKTESEKLREESKDSVYKAPTSVHSTDMSWIEARLDRVQKLLMSLEDLRLQSGCEKCQCQGRMMESDSQTDSCELSSTDQSYTGPNFDDQDSYTTEPPRPGLCSTDLLNYAKELIKTASRSLQRSKMSSSRASDSGIVEAKICKCDLEALDKEMTDLYCFLQDLALKQTSPKEKHQYEMIMSRMKEVRVCFCKFTEKVLQNSKSVSPEREGPSIVQNIPTAKPKSEPKLQTKPQPKPQERIELPPECIPPPEARVEPPQSRVKTPQSRLQPPQSRAQSAPPTPVQQQTKKRVSLADVDKISSEVQDTACPCTEPNRKEDCLAAGPMFLDPPAKWCTQSAEPNCCAKMVFVPCFYYNPHTGECKFTDDDKDHGCTCPPKQGREETEQCCCWTCESREKNVTKKRFPLNLSEMISHISMMHGDDKGKGKKDKKKEKEKNKDKENSEDTDFRIETAGKPTSFKPQVSVASYKPLRNSKPESNNKNCTNSSSVGTILLKDMKADAACYNEDNKPTDQQECFCDVQDVRGEDVSSQEYSSRDNGKNKPPIQQECCCDEQNNQEMSSQEDSSEESTEYSSEVQDDDCFTVCNCRSRGSGLNEAAMNAIAIKDCETSNSESTLADPSSNVKKKKPSQTNKANEELTSKSKQKDKVSQKKSSSRSSRAKDQPTVKIAAPQNIQVKKQASEAGVKITISDRNAKETSSKTKSQSEAERCSTSASNDEQTIKSRKPSVTFKKETTCVTDAVTRSKDIQTAAEKLVKNTPPTAADVISQKVSNICKNLCDKSFNKLSEKGKEYYENPNDPNKQMIEVPCKKLCDLCKNTCDDAIEKLRNNIQQSSEQNNTKAKEIEKVESTIEDQIDYPVKEQASEVPSEAPSEARSEASREESHTEFVELLKNYEICKNNYVKPISDSDRTKRIGNIDISVHQSLSRFDSYVNKNQRPPKRMPSPTMPLKFKFNSTKNLKDIKVCMINENDDSVETVKSPSGGDAPKTPMCQCCCCEGTPPIENDLGNIIQNRIKNRKRGTVYLKFTMNSNNLFHIQMASINNEFLGCFYATEAAVMEARRSNGFDGCVTLSVMEPSNSPSQVNRLVDHAFMVVQQDRKSKP